MKSANYPSIETITEDQLQEYLQDCDTVNEVEHSEEGREIRKASKTKTTKSDSQTTTPGYDGIPVIFPGKKNSFPIQFCDLLKEKEILIHFSE